MKLLGETYRVSETALRFRAARETALASNVANADTPGYRRTDLRFSDALTAAVGQMARTNPAHLEGTAGSASEPWRVERGPRGTRPDGNGVDLDQELLEVASNASAFTQQSVALSRLANLTRTAIRGERR
ncbi:MAG TPA: flagellar basal body rod protein FlgB [Myxococcota bacterium]|nr:flagellar basal body rod protein FlgB [Myxococcota bacterium]